jgi:hypothetical protein
MHKHTHCPPSVNPSESSDNARPLDGEAREPDGQADVSFDSAALEAPTPTPQVPGPDPFDPASLRLAQDFGAGLGVKKALLSIPVRKPANSWWVRVHPSAEYRVQAKLLVLKEDQEIHWVVPTLWPALEAEAIYAAFFVPRALYTAITRQGVLFLWPIRLPGPDGRVDEWSRTALEAAERATKGWVRVTSNLALGAYDVFEAGGQLAGPDWPAMPLKDLLRIAFKDRLIDSLDHPVLRRLRGET